MNIQLIQNMGMRYTLYRIRHEIEKRVGVLKHIHPLSPETKEFISLDKWRELSIFFKLSNLTLRKTPNDKLKESVKRLLQNEILFFSSEWKQLGSHYDWITNPDNGYRYDITKHWSEIPDFSKETGDIKYVWEKSRFSYIHTIIRNDYHNGEDHSEFMFSEIESWIDANPINQGPNWRCSQEISLRIINWCFALNYYRNTEALTESRWGKIQNVIYWSLHHVYNHIDFSRIAVRNNHAITETLFLALSNMLFPFIPETKKWASNGRIWFEKEIDYQIYNDGTYLQFSMNYHRVVVQLLTMGISITELHNQPFSSSVHEKAYKSVNFLFQCLQEENGYLPNYGANDGAWFFPLSDTDYRDFRPQLNALHFTLTGSYLWNDKHLKEESAWMGDAVIKNKYLPLKKQQGLIAFKEGGYYLFREPKMFTFVKCGSYKDRPSHADNLHIDLWANGENLLCDTGSYKYNTENTLIKYFSGTESHNTVMLDDHDQMLKGSRFIWYFWTQSELVEFAESDTEFVFKGKIKAFQYINTSVCHQRTIIKYKEKPGWKVIDEISNKPGEMTLRQLWHTNSDALKFKSSAGHTQKEAFRSLYYGIKEPIKQFEYQTNSSTLTTFIDIE